MGNDKLKSKLTDIRNKLYDRIEVGEMDAWALLSAIHDHLDDLDEFIDEELQIREATER